jgi:hypothetical protein
MNKNLPLTIDGIPNLRNELVLASMLDVAGIHLTDVLNRIGANDGQATEDDLMRLVHVHGLFQQIRNCVPISQDPEDARDVCLTICNEIKQHQEMMRSHLAKDADALREYARGLNLEAEMDAYLSQMGVRPSVSSTADDILRDLRETGTIGGSRAV